MNDDQLLRYSRHILLDDIGIEGQQRLLDAHALVIGAGGLGSPVALYLGSAGVGRITIVDHDTIDLTNLQRQIAHTLERVGRPKAESAARAIAAINRDVRVDARVVHADEPLLDQLVPEVDVVVDCTDNFKTRQRVNAACVHHAKPLVSGAAIGFDGQVSVYDTRRDASIGAVGFKTKLKDLWDGGAFATMLRARDVRVIALRRRDVVRLAVSNINARRVVERTGRWNRHAGSPALPPLEVAPEVLERMIEHEGLRVVGAEYELETGVVDFFDGVPGDA